MSFFKKLCCAFVLVSCVPSALLGVSVYASLRRDKFEQFERHYQSLGQILANSFKQMEAGADQTSRAALMQLADIEANDVLPADTELNVLAHKMGVSGFYVTDADGKFIRSSDYPIEKQTDNLFSYCEEYRGLLTGRAEIMQTPILPGAYLGIPAKFTMIPNRAHTRVLNSGFNFELMGKSLFESVEEDTAIVSVGLYAPTGRELGSFTKDGLQLKTSPPGDGRLRLAEVDIKVPASIADCCECKTRDVALEGDEYFYTLRMRVSDARLVESLNHLRNAILFHCGICLVVALSMASLLAKLLNPVPPLAEQRKVGSASSSSRVA